MHASRLRIAPASLCLSLAILLVAIPALAAPSAEGASFSVDTDVDSVDIDPGDGVCADATGACSIRAAVMETNALPGDDTIYLYAGGPGINPPS
jgi:hypothetical protein